MVNKGLFVAKKYFLPSIFDITSLGCSSVFSKLHFLGLALFYSLAVLWRGSILLFAIYSVISMSQI